MIFALVAVTVLAALLVCYMVAADRKGFWPYPKYDGRHRNLAEDLERLGLPPG